MAIKENESRIMLCHELLQFLDGNEDADNTRIWHMLTLQSGFNALNPEVFLYEYVITDFQLNLAVHEIETRGQGLSNYTFPARDYAQPDLPMLTYMGFDQVIWHLDKRTCQGIDEEGLCTWLTMVENLRNHLSWIPFI